MKGFQIIANNEFSVCSDLPKPDIKDDEVLIKTAYVGICGSDYPRIWSNEARYYPIILGHEFSGTIESVGKNIKDITVGEKVAVAPLVPCMSCVKCNQGLYSQCPNYSFIGSRRNGALAEFVAVPRVSVVKLSPKLDLKKAAFLEPLTVGIHALTLLNSQLPNKKIAVLGVGTIGLLTLQSLLIKGGTDVTALDIDDGKLDIAKQLGVKVLNTQNIDVSELSNQFDIVIETAGNIHTTKLCFTLADSRGEILYIGTPHGDVSFSSSEWELINRKELTIKGSWMNYSAPYPGQEWQDAQKWLLEDLINIDSLGVTISLEELPEKLRAVQNRTYAGKIVVKM